MHQLAEEGNAQLAHQLMGSTEPAAADGPSQPDRQKVPLPIPCILRAPSCVSACCNCGWVHCRCTCADHSDSHTTQTPLGTQAKASEPKRQTQETEKECLVCLGTFGPGDQIRVLPCMHTFHKECVDEWLNLGHNDCPLCKQEVNAPLKVNSEFQKEVESRLGVDLSDIASSRAPAPAAPRAGLFAHFAAMSHANQCAISHHVRSGKRCATEPRESMPVPSSDVFRVVRATAHPSSLGGDRGDGRDGGSPATGASRTAGTGRRAAAERRRKRRAG